MKTLTFSEYITALYESKKTINPKYSLRAFCRDLGVSPGRMVNFIKGRDYPSPEMIKRISLGLKLTSDQMEQLQSLLNEEKYLRRGNRFSKRLTQEEFRFISDWKTWSVLTLFQSHDFSPSLKYFCQKLFLSPKDVENSLAKLEEVGLIKKLGTFYKLLIKNVTTTSDIPSEDIRRVHKEFINLSLDSLDKIPVTERDITGITMCIDKGQLPELKQALAEFRAKFCQKAEASPSNDIYQLNIQFFPVKGQQALKI